MNEVYKKAVHFKHLKWISLLLSIMFFYSSFFIESYIGSIFFIGAIHCFFIYCNMKQEWIKWSIETVLKEMDEIDSIRPLC